MVTLGALGLPILLSAVVVWIASAIVWMVLPHHKTDFKGLPNEEALRSALRPQNLAPGQYNFPHIPSRQAMKQPEIVRKFEEGPVGLLTLFPSGLPKMGKAMGLSFGYYVVIGFFVAYVAGRTLAAGADYLSVFRVAGTVAWLGYGWAAVPDAIWLGRPWSSVAKHLADALLYGLLTAGVFGWLWPR